MKRSCAFAVTAPDSFHQGRVRWAIGEGDQRSGATAVQAETDTTAFPPNLNSQPTKISAVAFSRSLLDELVGAPFPT